MNWFLLHDQAFKTILSLVTKTQESGIDLKGYMIDHLCYRCISTDNYGDLSDLLTQYAICLQESMIDGRLVSIRKLHQPFRCQEWSIPCIELSAPKWNNAHPEGREHIEVVVTDLDAFDAQYGYMITERRGYMKTYNRDLEIEFPHARANGGQLAIKFHEQSIEDVIDYEKSRTI